MIHLSGEGKMQIVETLELDNPALGFGIEKKMLNPNAADFDLLDVLLSMMAQTYARMAARPPPKQKKNKRKKGITHPSIPILVFIF